MLGIKQIKEIQKIRRNLKNIVEIKMLGKEICDEYGLTVSQSLDILNGRYDDVIKILRGVNVNSEGSASYVLENGILIGLNH